MPSLIMRTTALGGSQPRLRTPPAGRASPAPAASRARSVPAAAPRGTPAATAVPPVTPKAASDAESAPSPSSSTLGSGRALASAPAATFNIVFVTSEVAPYSKTGGLGDVCGSLPQALAARGHRVMVVSPLYNGLPAEAADTGVDMNLLGAPGVGFRHLRSPAGVDYVFVAHPAFDRPDGLYGGGAADLQWRFALLSLAGLEAPLVLDLPGGGGEAGKAGGKAGGSSSSLSKYGEDCVFVANDWHAAMVPVYLAGKFRPGGVYGDARCVLAIHNLRHQGVFAPGTFSSLHLPGPWYGALEFQYPPHQRMGSYEEEGRAINTLKGGITTADRIVTVSPGYAHEITTPEGGWGMEGLLASRSYVLDGILNGICTSDWNPASDEHLPATYDAASIATGKAACKAALQAELGLPVNPAAPLLGFIGRLDYQKGADLVLAVAPWLMDTFPDAQLVCLGTGDPDLEAGLRWLEASHPDRARAWVGFNVPFSHRLTAAADCLLMPSRFEPCGLNQLYAMAYGTVPIAHATGGLRDTVLCYDPADEAGSTGWTFGPGCTADGLKTAITHALTTYTDYPAAFAGLQARGMARDSTWGGAAANYEQVFSWAKTDPPYAK